MAGSQAWVQRWLLPAGGRLWVALWLPISPARRRAACQQPAGGKGAPVFNKDDWEWFEQPSTALPCRLHLTTRLRLLT